MVTVRVEHGDVLERETDVVVLKYAQALYGVDKDVAGRIGAMPADLRPDVGTVQAVRSRHLGARTLVLIGVPQLDAFGYAEIRRFGRDAVVAAAREEPQAREVCLTLHGTGYGLDEAEAFRAEVAGVFDAVEHGSAGDGLRTVSIVEINRARADRLRDLLDTMLQTSEAPGRARGTSAGPGSAQKRRAFVAMPFTEDFADYFHYGIRPPLTGAGLLCERMDELHFTGDVVSTMRARILGAEVVVADLSRANPNVYLEVGYAWAAERPTVLICHTGTTPQFNVQGHRFLVYGSIRDLETRLAAELAGLGLTP